jgi:choline-sulfatase
MSTPAPFHYLGYPPQLFDLIADPDGTRDLGRDPLYADTLPAYGREVRAICDPEEVDSLAQADQMDPSSARSSGTG